MCAVVPRKWSEGPQKGPEIDKLSSPLFPVVDDDVVTSRQNAKKTRQSKQCGFSIYTFDNLKSKSMVRLVRAEKMVLSGLVFARKIARMILIQNI